jgi:hypothetical protein
MIAEKSVNCSLLSLPTTPGVELPTCGPMESLALMYILREQGDMVTQEEHLQYMYYKNLLLLIMNFIKMIIKNQQANTVYGGKPRIYLFFL